MSKKPRNPMVRVWREVYEGYKAISRRYGMTLSDLVSLTLLYTPIYCPHTLVKALYDGYDISVEEAEEIVEELTEELEEVIKVALALERKDGKEEREELRAEVS